MFADKTGDSVIIEAGEVIVRKKGNYQVMTNFLQSQVEPAKVTCPRSKLVSRALAEGKDLSIDRVRSLLKATAQQSTTYSAIFDLTNGRSSRRPPSSPPPIGQFTTDLSHWQDNSFYVRAPTRLTFDWLLTFGLTDDGQVANVTVKHVGWDKDEKDHLFVRGK
jgi:hypothetical protein